MSCYHNFSNTSLSEVRYLFCALFDEEGGFRGAGRRDWFWTHQGVSMASQGHGLNEVAPLAHLKKHRSELCVTCGVNPATGVWWIVDWEGDEELGWGREGGRFYWG